MQVLPLSAVPLNNRTYIYAFTSGGIYHGLSPTDSWDRLQPSHDPEMVSKKIDGWIADFSSPSIVTSVRFLIYMWKFSSKRSYKTASRQWYLCQRKDISWQYVKLDKLCDWAVLGFVIKDQTFKMTICRYNLHQQTTNRNPAWNIG